MIATWTETDQTKRWSEGLRFVQEMKNTAYHEEIKLSPYMAIFNCLTKMGLATSMVPQELIKN
jgi:hypothetical protein